MPISADTLGAFLARAIRTRREVSDAASAAIDSLSLADVISPANLADEQKTQESIAKLTRFIELIQVSKFAATKQQAAFAAEFSDLIFDYSPEEQQVANDYLQTRLLSQILKEVAELDACADLATSAKRICEFIDSCRGRFDFETGQVLFVEDDDLAKYQDLYASLQRARAKLRAT